MRWKVLLAVAVVLPSMIEFSILFRQSFSVPYQDDYAVILAFAQEYRQLPNWTAKIVDILTKQTNDYKLAFPHLIIASDLELTGRLNFFFFVAFGNLCLLPTAFLLWRTYQLRPFQRLDCRLTAFLPISLMFFSPVYWETLDWSMAGLQNLGVILFSLLSITLLASRVPKSSGFGRTFLASVSAVLAALCSANGFLLAPIGLLILIPRKAFLAATLWCASFIVPVVIYLYHYVPYSYSVQVTHSTSWMVKSFYFFAFLGCAVLKRWVAALLGLALSFVFALSIWRRFDREYPVPFYFTLWIFATAALVGGIRGAIASRYSVYSIFVFIFAYLFLAMDLPGLLSATALKRLYTASLAGALLFFVSGTAFGWRQLAKRKTMVIQGIEHYRINPAINSPMIDPDALKVAPKESEFERIELSEGLRDHLLVLPQEENLH